MKAFIIIGLFLVAIGLVMLLIDWPAWSIGIALIVVGVAKVFFFGWGYKKMFPDKIDRDREV